MGSPPPIRFRPRTLPGAWRALRWAGAVAITLLAPCCGEREEDTGNTPELGSGPPPLSPEALGEPLPEVLSSAPPARDDPSADGWETEVLAANAGQQLKALGHLFFKEGSADLAALLAPDFTCEPLVPSGVETVLEDDLVLVERQNSPTSTPPGEKSLANALAEIRKLSRSGGETHQHVHFKVVSVSPGSTGDTFQTEVIFSLSFSTGETLVEHHATWLVDWKQPSNQIDLPSLTNLAVRDFSRTTTKQGTPLYSDVTSSALGDTPCYRSQLGLGLNHWLGRLPVRAMLNRFGTPGLALGDVNGDGLEDLYLCQEPGLPNRLFLQKPDGTAEETSAAWGVDWIDDSRSALFLDLDNDGDQDLVVALYGMVVIARNEDRKRFTVATALPCTPSTTSLAAADYDRDGLLDLYVCGYAQDDGRGASIGAANDRFVYHDARNGGANSLFRNGGNLAFHDVTAPTGLDQNNRRWSFAASWEDYDDDGDQDLYVANDYGRNNLYRNDGGKFVDVAASTGSEDSASGMSAAWGDYDRDGRMDLYVANMFSAAGSRITTQKQFKTGTREEIRDRFRRFARGNTLFRNTGEGFEDVSVQAGVTLGRWAWSSNFVDLNNDAWPDFVVANGYLSSETDSGDL